MKARKLVCGSALLLLCAAVLLPPAVGAAGPGQQKLYVLSSQSDDMTVIDVATNKIIGSVVVGDRPHGIAATAAQDVLWVATEFDNGLTLVDTVKDEVIKEYKIFGKRPNEIDVTSDGRFVYVPCYGEGVYQVFDTVKEEIVASIPTDGMPHNVVVSPDDKYMYFSPMDRGVRTAAQMERAGLPSSSNEKVYIAETASHSIVGTIPTGNTPRPITLSPDGTRLYVNTDDLLGFLVLDIPARKVIAKAEFGLTPEERAAPSRSHGIGVTPDGREVWSTDINHGLVFVYDVTVTPPKQIARLETGRTPLWLTITPDGKTVYVANVADDTISAFDVASKKEVARIQVEQGKSPKRMLVVTVPS